MPIQFLRGRFATLALGLGFLLVSGGANADPPMRVARLGYAQGQVSFSPSGQPNSWAQATVNRPLTTGDQLWVDARSRAELQIGGTAIRLGENTSVTLLNVDDNITQIQLVQGTLKVHVRSIDPSQILEVDTPNIAMTVHRAGDYRLDVGRNGDATDVSVRSGEADVYGDGASYSVREGRSYRFFGIGLSDYVNLLPHIDDELDQWAHDRDYRTDISVAARYVSPELVGYEDLDAGGAWRNEASYGYVWVPHRVRTGWTPYSDGRWTWIAPWGWTWVDAAPWGYAVSHYGRWANIRGAWAWVPGPLRERAVYAPALVVFVGGRDFPGASASGGLGAIGWFPLAPREVYRPTYQTSPRYFEYVNRSNAVIVPIVITNSYNTHITNVTNVTNVTNITNVIYANRSVRGAVVAVPMQAFAQSQSVARAVMALPTDAAARALAEHVTVVLPVAQSVHSGTPAASAKPPDNARLVIARTAPPTSPMAFAAQQPQPTAMPGAPAVDPRHVQPRTPTAAPTAPQVQLLTTAKPPAPGAVPPPMPERGSPSPAEHKPDIAQRVSAPVDPRKRVDSRMEAALPEAVKTDAARATGAYVEANRAKTARDEAARVEASRADAAGAKASKVEFDRAKVAREAKVDATKADAARAADAQRAAAARDEADKLKAARQDAARANAVKEGAARAAAVQRAEAERANAGREQADLAKAARADAARAAALREEAAKARAAKAGAAPNPSPAEPHQRPQSERSAQEKKARADEDVKKP